MRCLAQLRKLIWMGLILTFLFLPVNEVVAQTCVAPPSGLVSWWPGDGNANDIAGSNNGTLQGGATFAPGLVGKAFSFTAVGHQVEVPDSPNLNLESLPGATFEGWFKSFGGLDTQGGDVVIVAKHTCGIGTGWFFTTQQGGFIGNHYVGGFGVTELNLNDSQFHHFAIVKDGSNYFEYIDGNLISSDTEPAFGTATAAPVQIGNITTGTCSAEKHQLNGLVDEVEIYNRALSSDEIKAIFDAGSAGKCKVASLDHFKCYDAEGDAVNAIVDLEDQFGVEPQVLVGEPDLFCNPVDKNGEGISNPVAHLTCYRIADSDKVREVTVENQFGIQTLEVEDSELLCVPSEKIQGIQEEDDDDD